MPQEASSADIRAHLIQRVTQWRELIPEDDRRPLGTLGPGMAQKAISSVGVLLHRAVTMLLPDADLGIKPTFGRYVNAIEQYGRDETMSCAALPRKLVTPSEIEVLKRLSRARSRLAHLEERPVWDAAAIGHFKPSEMRELLDLIDASLRLPIFDELVCREERAGQGETPGDKWDS